jgi:hypothetical protein
LQVWRLPAKEPPSAAKIGDEPVACDNSLHLPALRISISNQLTFRASLPSVAERRGSSGTGVCCFAHIMPNGLFACRKLDACSGNVFLDQGMRGWLAEEDEMPVSAVMASHSGGGWNHAEFPLKFNSLEFSGFTRQAGLTVAELTDYYCRSEETRRMTSPDDRRWRGYCTVLPLPRCRVNCHWRLS